MVRNARKFHFKPLPRGQELWILFQFANFAAIYCGFQKHKNPQLESALTELGFINSGILSEEESLYFPNTKPSCIFVSGSANTQHSLQARVITPESELSQPSPLSLKVVDQLFPVFYFIHMICLIICEALP